MNDKLPESLENLISLLAENMTTSEETGNDFVQQKIEEPADKTISIAQLSENLSSAATEKLGEAGETGSSPKGFPKGLAGASANASEQGAREPGCKEDNLEAVNAEFVEEDSPVKLEYIDDSSYLDSQEEITSDQGLEENSADLVTAQDFLQKPDNLESAYVQDWMIKKERQIDDLASSMNNIIPLMVELLSIKTNNSREAILQAVVPIIDKIIDERSTQDDQGMAAAIAKILPHAISQEIQNQPQSIAKAIAPEVALSIEEQIVIDEDAISRALGSEMGKAIKAQIELERDAMVDALYPVIGSTISKYMAEVVQSINAKVEETLSPQGLARKMRAKVQGVSEAELILKEAIGYRVNAIFLIDKASGLVIKEVQPNTENLLDSDMIAGMLTAIRSFANDCMASGSELDEIDYGNFRILLETAGYCYLAVVVQGEPDQQFRDRIRQSLSHIVLKHGKQIEHYNGDPGTISPKIQPLLEKLIVSQEQPEEKAKSPTTLLWLVAILLSIFLIPWGIVRYRAKTAQRIEQQTAIALDSNPQLSIYRLRPQVRQGRISLTGKVPSDYFRELAEQVTTEIAKSEELELDNQIIAVNTIPDPGLTEQEVVRTTKLFNQRSRIAITSSYQNNIVTIDGFILDAKAREVIAASFREIPGVEQIVFLAQNQLPKLESRIYFESGSSKFRSDEDSSKIDSIKQFLDQYPLIHLRIIAHSDLSGSRSINQKLSLARAEIIYQKAIAKQVSPQRLQVITSLESPPDVLQGQPLWLSRCVRFEAFIPGKDHIQ